MRPERQLHSKAGGLASLPVAQANTFSDHEHRAAVRPVDSLVGAVARVRENKGSHAIDAAVAESI